MLSCLPCADLDTTSSAHSSTEIASIEGNHSHEKSADTCSPFCICNCCGSQIFNYIQSTVVDFPMPSEGVKTQLPTYKSIFSSNFYGSIWQPPQIA